MAIGQVQQAPLTDVPLLQAGVEAALAVLLLWGRLRDLRLEHPHWAELNSSWVKQKRSLEKVFWRSKSYNNGALACLSSVFVRSVYLLRNISL